MRDFHQSGRSPVYSTNGMAATSMPIASLTAIEILRAGGNAVDAAVAACAVLAVVEPQSTGIGGDCFCLYAPAGGGKVVAVNGSGRSAAAASLDAIEANGPVPPDNISPHGSHHPRRHFRLAVAARHIWDQGLRRSAAARDPLRRGRLSRASARGVGLVAERGQAAPRRKHGFSCPAAERPALATASCRRRLAGPCARSPRTARTASTAGRSQPTWRRRLKAKGGVQTEEDFANGRKAAEFVAPISLQWRGLDVWQCPPNGPGLVALMILGELEALGDAPDGPGGSTRFHRHIEAARFAYRDRDAFLADPRQQETPLAASSSADYLAASRATHRRQARASPIAAARQESRSSRMATPSRFRSSTATGTPAASSTRSIRTSAAALSAKAPACSCRTADCASLSSAVIPTRSRPIPVPPTPSCPAWRRATVGPGCVSA